ncbi:hypothetical protein OEZ85_000041 [Tetradesmus obliquus]|uniref:Uncharacterized protein n=1 Tax=Tetradesmus obliquus TaxID=3088 RepID=A0ABY8USE6_TETOB|nr:hypothetical protein OEZ85_000041 [Tetradesmus obliquus]
MAALHSELPELLRNKVGDAIQKTADCDPYLEAYELFSSVDYPERKQLFGFAFFSEYLRGDPVAQQRYKDTNQEPPSNVDSWTKKLRKLLVQKKVAELQPNLPKEKTPALSTCALLAPILLPSEHIAAGQQLLQGLRNVNAGLIPLIDVAPNFSFLAAERGLTYGLVECLDALTTAWHESVGGDAAMFENMLWRATRTAARCVSHKRQHERKAAAAATAEQPDGAGAGAAAGEADQEPSSKRVCT